MRGTPFVLGAVGLLVLSTRSAGAQEAPLAPTVELEVERIAAAGSLWPGFDPLAVPLAIYDGERTWLFRHPAPPAGFVPVSGEVGTFARPGRFEAVTANTSAEIGGVMTATLMVNGPRGESPPHELAAVAIHEAFHVYQRTHHPGWQGNEGDLLVYPVTNPDLLALRRLESEALRRALANREDAGAACWARVAMVQRQARFTALDSAFVEYERLTELNEGLAAYLQLRAAGSTQGDIPADGFLPEAVRQRAYHTGPAMALLLDRLSPGWQAALEQHDGQSLDGLLETALRSTPPSAPCDFTPVQVGAARRDARIAAAGVTSDWGKRQRAFETKEGWRVLIQSAKGKPLWPQGFDPLNVDRVDGALIHTRYLKLGNDAGQMTALEEPGAEVEARTEGVGPHPMFNGVSWVEVVLSIKPAVQRPEGRLVIYGPGFSADFSNATLIESGRQLLVQLN